MSTTSKPSKQSFTNKTFKAYKCWSLFKFTPSKIGKYTKTLSTLLAQSFVDSSSYLTGVAYKDSNGMQIDGDWKMIRDALDISWTTSNITIKNMLGGENERYSVHTIKVSFGNTQRQIIHLITKPSNDSNRNGNGNGNKDIRKNRFKTLLLSRCNPQIQSAFIRWLSFKFDTPVKPIIFKSDFIKSTLGDYIKSQTFSETNGNPVNVGNVGINFSVDTLGNNLQTIALDIQGSDITNFIIAGEKDFFVGFYEYLQTYTGIDFHQLNMARIHCNWIFISNEGRLKLSSNLELGVEEEEGNEGSNDKNYKITIWQILHRIYTSFAN